ncbi:Protein of unknown function [Vibrio xiamenensis]|uniref:Lipoprotein n=1 Tax=Vibrio xiamenensis TaxID=861298 RepID=A0A1G8B2F8_9VIBR|nr:DUF2799 domain-containing protein [Vibrio xiamenensis]SDH27377.1 Protein of unknown function [Vibrio xiamenensis]
MKVFWICAVLGLTACSATTEQLAEQGNWHQIGYQDGIAGHSQRTQRNLQSMGNVNQADYAQGYLEGVQEYCNPAFAYQIGLSGQYYEGVCEGTPQGQKFRMEWQRGWNDYNQ